MSQILSNESAVAEPVITAHASVDSKPLLRPKNHERLEVLDGWRAISILLVLACHLLPLGPKSWNVNLAAGHMGMSIFFTLSGFLITSTLFTRMNIREFFIRRLCRIVPLAYVYAAIALAVAGVGPMYYLAHAAFIVNYDHAYLLGITAHLWSLCVEVQFYLFIGLLILIFGKRGFLMIPAACLAVTAMRVATGTHASIVTHLRVDEILSGACMALIHLKFLGSSIRPALSRAWLVLILAPLLFFASHPVGGPLNYLRPYLASAMVAATMWGSETFFSRWLAARWLNYVARISYALYVIHPAMAAGWMGTGSTATKYLLKRPITFALTFLLAHISTFYFEQRWIDWGKKLTTKKK